MHPLRAKGINRQHGDKRGIDAARQAENNTRKTVLVDIVAKPQRQPAIECRHALIGWGDLAAE